MTRKADKRTALILKLDMARPMSIHGRTVLVHDIGRCALDDWASVRSAGVTFDESDRWRMRDRAIERAAELLWSYAIEAEHEGRAPEYVRGVVFRVLGYSGFAVGLIDRHAASSLGMRPVDG